MKVIELHSSFGLDALTLADRPEPTTCRRDVIVRMRAAALNDRDWQVECGDDPNISRLRPNRSSQFGRIGAGRRRKSNWQSFQGKSRQTIRTRLSFDHTGSQIVSGATSGGCWHTGSRVEFQPRRALIRTRTSRDVHCATRTAGSRTFLGGCPNCPTSSEVPHEAGLP